MDTEAALKAEAPEEGLKAEASEATATEVAVEMAAQEVVVETAAQEVVIEMVAPGEGELLLCEEGLELPCPACLSLGRAMAPLREPARAYCMLLAGLRQEDAEELVTYTLLCWECSSFVERMLRFQDQVLHANILMRAYVADETERQDKTFSALGSVTKVGYDQMILYERPEPESWELEPKADPALPPAVAEPEDDKLGLLEPTCTEQPTRRRRQKRPEQPVRKSERKYKPAKKILEGEFEAEASVKKERKSTHEKQTRRKNIVKTIGSWPGKKVLLKGRKKNVRIVSMSMPESEMLRFRAEDRASDAYAGAPFKCDNCIKGFTFINLLERHNATYHAAGAGSHLCDICAVRLPTDEQLQRHRKKHYNLYVCTACGYPHRHLPDVCRHYAAAHESGKQHPCSHCDEVFASSRKMRYHREITHKEAYKCEYCNKVMRNQQSFKAHLLIHTGMPTLECSLCRKACRGETGLYAHMRTAHSSESAEEAYCAECDVQFKSKAIYRSHLRTSVKHATPSQLKYCCERCEKKFISETALKQHHRYYHMEYTCNICSKRLNNWYSLDKHIKFVHEGREMPRKHICETCGKGFKTRRALESHQMTHTGERPYACGICGATFAQKSTLRTHQRLVHFKLKKPQPGAAAVVEALPV